MEDRPGRSTFDGQPDEVGRIGPVDGRPAVLTLGHVAGDAPFPCDRHERVDEAAVADTVDGRGESEHRGADTDACQGQDEERGGVAANGRIGSGLRAGHEAVVLGRDATWRHAEHPGGEDEGAIASGKRGSHGLDGATVGVRRGREVASEGHLVLKRQVDDTVGVVRRLGQAGGIVDITPGHRGAGLFDPHCGGLGTGQADDLVSCMEQLGHGGRSDPARCAGDEDPHGITSRS